MPPLSQTNAQDALGSAIVKDLADGVDGAAAPSVSTVVAGVDGGGNLQALSVDTAGRLQVITNNTTPIVNAFIDASNSTSANLGIGATYTGTFVDVASYSNLNVLIFTNQVSATDGFIVEYSTDGVNVDDNDVFTIPASSGQQYSFPLPARYYRVRYVNGGVAQTIFRLQSKVHNARPKPSSQRIGAPINVEQDAEVTVSAPARLSLVPGSPFTVSVGVATGTFLAANASRKGLIIQNNTSARVSFGLGVSAVLGSGITLLPGGIWNMNEMDFYVGQINAIASVAASVVAGQEFS